MNNLSARTDRPIVQMDESETIQVLQSSLYPGASIPSIRMVLWYCKAAGLDPFQKPVHLVAMWDSKARAMRDVVMPGINLYRIQASRSGQFAGMSEPEFGPNQTKIIGGQEITFPEWCRVTVRRLMDGGHVAEFTAREFWIENYATKGGPEKSIAPNAMWTKRPRGQLAKCAAAQALRIAFPEIASQPTAEEMEGKQLAPDDTIELDMRSECIAKAEAAQTEEELKRVSKECVPLFQKARDTEGYSAFVKAVQARGAAIKAKAAEAVPEKPTEAPDPAFVAAMEATEAKEASNA